MSFIARLESNLTGKIEGGTALQAPSQTALSQARVDLWVSLIPRVQELYTHVDEYTADAELMDGHILQNDAAMTHLITLLHNIYLLVREDKYMCFTLFGLTQIQEEDLGAIYYRFGKNSLKPMLYVILRFEKECKLLTYLLQTTEKVVLDYVFQRLDDELFKEYVRGCKQSQNILLGLFDFGKHLQASYGDVASLQEWLSDVTYFQAYEQSVREKLDLLFEKILAQAKSLNAPSAHLLQVLNAE